MDESFSHYPVSGFLIIELKKVEGGRGGGRSTTCVSKTGSAAQHHKGSSSSTFQSLERSLAQVVLPQVGRGASK